MDKKYDILVADDHEVSMYGTIALLEETKLTHKIYKATNGKEALNSIELNPVDILITDIEMPIMDGIELSTKLRSQKPSIKIIVVTMHHKREYINSLTSLQVEGIVDKADGIESIKDALIVVARNGTYRSATIDKVIKRKLNQADLSRKEKIEKRLSPRLLGVLVELPGGTTSKEIADRLFLSPRTIEDHRKTLFEIFEAKNIAELIHLAHSLGFIE